MTRRRLDAELVRRGLAASRAEAQEAVRAGLVTVAGAPATKAATMVADDAAVELAGPARRFVSRGGEKLDAALARFEVDPAGLECLDAGASTGGFTDRLLRGGAAHVTAVDVGYGQLAWSLRTDDRVTVLERTNVRELHPGDLPTPADLVVADLSFISLRLVLAALVGVAAPGAVFVLLVKPQFEAGPADVSRGGVVRDPAVRRRVLDEVTTALDAAGVTPQGLMASPVLGPAGNVEFLLYGRRGASPTAIDLDAVVAEGERVGAS
jgi:23S rRNA (cytidine1920-2'-O)/16S rRNA (cytidine1409-2'-O)-methyltransferase